MKRFQFSRAGCMYWKKTYTKDVQRHFTHVIKKRDLLLLLLLCILAIVLCI